MHRRRSDLSGYTRSIFLPFIYDYSTEEVPQINATINGANFELPIDTGSTGLLIGAPLVPDVDPSAGVPAYTFLTSSRILYSGRLVDLEITFHGANGSHAVTKVPVLVVDESVVCPWYDVDNDTFSCPYNPHAPKPKPRDTSQIMYMGVGFGRSRPRNGHPSAVPKVNPFLNVESINGEKVDPRSHRLGYTVSTEGVHLGLTEENSLGFEFTDLNPGMMHDIDPRDWAMVDMSFSVNGQGANRGMGLIDTGIAQMYIRPDEGSQIPSITIPNPNPGGVAKFVHRVKPGTRIEVGFPSLVGEIASQYSFEVGTGTLMEPAYAVPVKPGRPPYINTGRNFLFGNSIAFDAVGGRLGFRPVKGLPISSL